MYPPTSSVHVPVLYQEVLTALSPQEGGVFVDGTLGGGGHTEAIARTVAPTGWVIAFDRDIAAIDRTQKRLETTWEKLQTASKLPVRFAHSDYRYFDEALSQLGIDKIDGFLLDLGQSSDQLADRQRGFSFDADGPLDLRFDTSEGEPAWRMLEWMSPERIADVLYQYGEEKCSRAIARMVVKRRDDGDPIRTARDFAMLVRRCVPQEKRRNSNATRIDSATRSFQAMRILVNDELGSLESVLQRAPDFLKIGGKIAVISFHSLEDRIVKHTLRTRSDLRVITKKPIEASEEELAANPRSRSAKLRIAEKM